MASLASADRASLQGRRVIPRQAPPGNAMPSDIDFPLFVDGQQGLAQNGITEWNNSRSGGLPSLHLFHLTRPPALVQEGLVGRGREMTNQPTPARQKHPRQPPFRRAPRRGRGTRNTE